MLGRVANRVMKQIAAQPRNLSICLQGLVYVVASPASTLAIVEPQLVIGTPARMLYPAAEIEREPGHLEPRRFRFGAALDLLYLAGQLRRHSLIGVEAEDPIVACLVRGEV